MHRPTRTVATRLGEVEHLLIDALAGHRGIAVDQHGQHLLPSVVAATGLAGIDSAFDDRIDDLEVRRIESQRQMAWAARRHDVGRIAEVVLDVARGEILRLLALELVEQHRRRLAQRVDEHIQATTVRHADDDIVNAAAARDANHFIERDNQRFAAFKREALLPDVARVQVALERLGSRQAFKQAQLLACRVGALAVNRLDPRLNPAPLGDVVDVHVLDADPAAVGFLERIEDLPEGCPLGDALERTRVERRVDVGVAQAVERRFEFVQFGTRLALQRIEIGPARAQRPIRADHLEDADLLLVVRRPPNSRLVSAVLRLFGKGMHHRQMRHVARNRPRQLGQLVKIVAPLAGNGRRIIEIVFVELFDERGIAAEEMRRSEQLIHHDSDLRSGCSEGFGCVGSQHGTIPIRPAQKPRAADTAAAPCIHHSSR